MSILDIVIRSKVVFEIVDGVVGIFVNGIL